MWTKRLHSPRYTTLIGSDTEIQGDLTFGCGLHVDGRIKGNVQATNADDATLTVSEQGTIEGDVRVPNAILDGTIQGNVYVSDRLELASRARIRGAVHYRALEMAAGAEVNGELVRMDETTPRLLGYSKEVDAASLAGSGDER